MTIDELEDMAFNGAELPSGLGAAETILFLSFRNLYDFARRTEMPPEQGKREKHEILTSYRRYKTMQEMTRDHAAIIRDVEMAMTAYVKEPTIENADRMWHAFDGKVQRAKKAYDELEDK